MRSKRPLTRYYQKRDFKITREPKGTTRIRSSGMSGIFVIQEHHARRLHYDLRLEAEGVLKSWAVTKEPPREPSLRRLAIQTEDHPLEYGKFEGQIPKGEYGAGSVEIWDSGTYESERPLPDEINRGQIEVVLRGKKLHGRFLLIRIEGSGEKSAWLLMKKKPRVIGLKLAQTKRSSTMARYGKAAAKSVASAIRREKSGTLKSGRKGHGGAVKSRQQAIAIGLSEARRKGAKVPPKRKSS